MLRKQDKSKPDGFVCKLTNVGLNADFPCTGNYREVSYLQNLLTSQLFHHLDEISCEDQTYFSHILVQWQPKTNDTHNTM